jgi:excisionase family DNA binding protein
MVGNSQGRNAHAARSSSSDESIQPIAGSIATAARVSGLGRTTIYRLIGEGRVEAVKAGGRTLVIMASLRAYLHKLPAYERETQAGKVQAAVEGRQARRRSNQLRTE